MTLVSRETLVLTLPPDPSLARLTRLATLHFLLQNGVKVMAAQRRARDVERRARTMLRAASDRAPKGQGEDLDLVLTRGSETLEVDLRRGTQSAPSRLMRLPRTGPS